MRVMIVGGGGREHAIAHKIMDSGRVTELYALPGNAGIAQIARCVPIPVTDIAGILSFALSEGIHFAIISPEDPLALGAADQLRAAGIPTFGPSQAAARIESSKVFSKTLMQKYGIPTASYHVFDALPAALEHLRTAEYPIVLKADGLALGKGVIIAQNYAEAECAASDMMEGGKFGESGRRVVIEEYLTGHEVSVLALTDGKTIKPLASSMDHKRALDGDQGLNTGGMGAIAPSPFYTNDIAARCMDEIFLPTLRAMNAEGCPFEGCLYFGLMLTKQGPKVIEYNCRFGDPETQAVLKLYDGDLLAAMEAVSSGTLNEAHVGVLSGASCCVMVASGGYPGAYRRGLPIQIQDMPRGVTVYHSGTALKQGELVTAGGRVLGVAARADSLKEAIRLSYEGVNQIAFEGMFYRKDIGLAAMEARV